MTRWVHGWSWTSIRRSRPSARSPVEGAHDTAAAAIEHVRIDHRRVHVLVAEELLDGADVVAGLQEMGRKAVAQRVRGDRLANARLPCRQDDGSRQGLPVV